MNKRESLWEAYLAKGFSRRNFLKGCVTLTSLMGLSTDNLTKVVEAAEAMKNADYEHLGYTMQRRVLSPKKDAISTYEILAYDGNSALITESSREGHRAVIRANTMTEKERDAVRQELRRKK